MNTYWSKEPYTTGRLFTKLPTIGIDEKVILTGGTGPDLPFTPETDPSYIRKGKYTQLVRIKTAPQNVSGKIFCYCRDQIYQFCIKYKATCHVCDPMAVWNSQFPDLDSIAEEYYRNLFSSEAVHHEMRDTVAFQQTLSTSFKDSLQMESGVQIGPLQSIQVEMDSRYRTHLETLQTDRETTEAEIERMKNAEQLQQAPITEMTAMLRGVLDGTKSADQMMQEMKQRKLNDFSQLKTILEQLNELRTTGIISERDYQSVVNQQLRQITPALEQSNAQDGKFAPLPSDL